MKLVIKRFKDIEDGTLGEFALLDSFRIILKGYTLEPAGPDMTEPNKDRRVPKGEYNVVWHNSPRFKKILPLLYNDLVPRSRYILIHAGNYPKDTEGCILLGSSYDDNGVYSSKKVLDEFIKLSYGHLQIVEIKDKVNDR